MKADFYTEVYNIVREIPYGRAGNVQRPERTEPALPPGGKQPRQISSQLGGTTGIIGERRHYLQEEWLR